MRSVSTRHGNAGPIAWSDDGRNVYVGNGEGNESVVKIAVTDENSARIDTTRMPATFIESLAQKSGVLVVVPTNMARVFRLDLTTLATMWEIPHAQLGDRGVIALAVGTDGTNIYLPLNKNPGELKVIRASDGAILHTIVAPDGWKLGSRTPAFYGDVVIDGTRLYVVVPADREDSTNYPGGVYVFDKSTTPPKYLGKIAETSALAAAASGNKLWVTTDNMVKSYNVANMAAPSLLGTWRGPHESGPGGTQVKPIPMRIRANSAGTRLYATYKYVTVSGEIDLSDWYMGFSIFDASGDTPVQLARHDWLGDLPNTSIRIRPSSIALSPDETKVAVSYHNFGVRIFRIEGDRIRGTSRVATTGEGHDVYVDGEGYLYAFANDDIQIIDEQTGEHVGVFVTGSAFEGQWRHFRDGTIILPSARNNHGRLILRLKGSVVTPVAALGGPATSYDEVFEDPYLYSGTDAGLYIQQVGEFDRRLGGYPISVLGHQEVGGKLTAITKLGSIVWGLGPDIGVVAIDVSNPHDPRVIFRDRFAYTGGHAGIVTARGRVYAGAADAGLIVYDAHRFRRIGAIPGLNVKFLDKVGADFLVVANYWFTAVLEGMVVYDIRETPDQPRLIQIFPGNSTNANFRVRVFGNRIYRVPLYGIDILEMH